MCLIYVIVFKKKRKLRTTYCALVIGSVEYFVFEALCKNIIIFKGNYVFWIITWLTNFLEHNQLQHPKYCDPLSSQTHDLS